MSKFSNSRIVSNVDLNTGRPAVTIYSRGESIDIHRCLNCGMDGRDHLGSNMCGNMPSEVSGIHIVTSEEIASAYLEYFRRFSYALLGRVAKEF